MDAYQESIDIIKNNTKQFIDNFYKDFFARVEKLDMVFRNTNIDTQKETLNEGLKFILNNLERPKVLSVHLKHLGVRHITYEVQEFHYEYVKQSLLVALKSILKDKLDDDLLAKWDQNFEIITTFMKEGAKIFYKSA